MLIFLSDLLGRHIKGHCPHVYRGEAVNAGHYEEKARTLKMEKYPISIQQSSTYRHPSFLQAAKSEYYCSFIFLDNLDKTY